ncbi:MAG: NAAT family transporter [Betaproteobacteria bacterium]|nr:NAAT family transporter [Betaproteobacteria bacterium]
MFAFAGTEYLRFLIKLIAVLDPFFAVPVFLSLTAGRTDVQRRHLAQVISLTVFIVLLLSGLAGATILELIGASLASFRLGGGLVLLAMAFAMLHATPGNVRQTAAEASEIDGQESLGIVPLAIPLLAGPGAISMVIVAMNRRSWAADAMFIACIAAAAVLIWVILRLAVPIGHALGTTGLNIANRLLGLLVAAIAIQMMANGLKELFPLLSATH